MVLEIAFRIFQYYEAGNGILYVMEILVTANFRKKMSRKRFKNI